MLKTPLTAASKCPCSPVKYVAMKIKVNKVTQADLPLDLDLAPDLRHVAAEVVQQHLGLVSHLNLHRLACGLHP